MNYSIETENLSLWYGDFQALIDVNSKIPDGQITSLIGPSGCGKTTLLRCFNRVNERYGNVTTKGKIEVLGKNIYDADVSARTSESRRHGVSETEPLTDLGLRKCLVWIANPLANTEYDTDRIGSDC